jgi:hypothetical protein
LSFVTCPGRFLSVESAPGRLRSFALGKGTGADFGLGAVFLTAGIFLISI